MTPECHPLVCSHPTAIALLAQRRPRRKALPGGPSAARGPAVKAATPVTLNFVNADIEAVTRAMGVI